MLSLCGPEDVQKQTGWTDVAEYFLNRRLKNVVVTLGKKGVSTIPTSLRVAMLGPRRIMPYSTHPVQGAFPVALRPFHRPVRVSSLVGNNTGITGDSFVGGHAAQYMAQKQKGQWDVKAVVQYGREASARGIEHLGCLHSRPSCLGRRS
jgi:sugar/nucleoside kinase (ribokinase family)